jgi:phosphoribosylanthranilate isomerase
MKFVIKVCGVTRPEDAAFAARSGAAAIGLNFWRGSKRFVEDARAREIIAAIPPHVLKIGVFVNAHRWWSPRPWPNCGWTWSSCTGTRR